MKSAGIVGDDSPAGLAAARQSAPVRRMVTLEEIGQLAGGVAHDFNNILTAILGYCDLMLMRHSPGDSDYDDIQQIRANSNRAASLTRQLLAFRRQQTLRPQVLQLPDVIAEVSTLLKRLLGDEFKLEIDIAEDDSGKVFIYSNNADAMNRAVQEIDALCGGGAQIEIKDSQVSRAHAVFGLVNSTPHSATA